MLSAFRHGSGLGDTLSRGAGISFVTQVCAVGLGYVAHVLLARWMGVTEYGIYVYSLGWAVPLAALGGLGAHMVALRFVPTYVSSGDLGLVRGSYRIGNAIAFGAAAVVSLGAGAILWALGSGVARDLFMALAVAVSIVPLLSVTHFNASFLKALKRVGFAGLSDVIRPPLLVAGGSVLVLTGLGVAARNLLVVLGVALLATAIVQYIFVRGTVPTSTWGARPKSDIPAWKKALGAMLLIEVFQALMIKADILLIGLVLDVESVAIFGVASRVAGLVGFVVAAVSAMAGPMFTQLHSQGRFDALRDLVTTASRWMLWPSLAAALILTVSSPFVLGLFGREFIEGTHILWILLVAQVVHAAAGPVFVLVTFTGFHEQSARIYGYMLLLNIALNVAGIYTLGLPGAAIAALITAFTWSLMLHRVVSSKLNLHASLIVQWIRRPTPDH